MHIPKELHEGSFDDCIESIKTLYFTDDEFRTLCDDYCISKTNIEKYGSKEAESKWHENEYRQLAQELEKEIVAYVAQRNNRMGRSS